MLCLFSSSKTACPVRMIPYSIFQKTSDLDQKQELAFLKCLPISLTLPSTSLCGVSVTYSHLIFCLSLLVSFCLNISYLPGKSISFLRVGLCLRLYDYDSSTKRSSFVHVLENHWNFCKYI